MFQLTGPTHAYWPLSNPRLTPLEEEYTFIWAQLTVQFFPVRAMLAYLALRGGQAGPLFITKEGRGFTHPAFSSALDSLLSKLKLNHKNYNAHSFRIGAATSVTQARIPESQIKVLGRWQSDAYQQYVKTLPMELANLTKQLAGLQNN